MNSRERFLAIMNFEPVDRTMLWEFGYWSQTMERWYDEGLTEQKGPTGKVYEGCIFGEALIWDPETAARDNDIHTLFGFDEGIYRVPLNSYVYPLFERKLVREEGDTVIEQDPRGHIVQNKKDRSSIPHIIKTLVESRDDWERVKAERFQPSLDGRLPDDWETRREILKKRDYPLCIGGIAAQCGFYHTARYLLGADQLLYGFYEQPDLVKAIMNDLADFWVDLFDQVLNQIDVDLGLWTEDIGYNAGPFISPELFREFMLPPYKKLIGVLDDHSVKIKIVDTDGNVLKLLPEFLGVGVTGLSPNEAAAHMHVWEMRQTYPRLQILGGIDKRALAAGINEIDKELEMKVPQTLKSGGYIPHVDHLVPPDVPWDNFKYYRKRLGEMIREVK